MTDIERLSPLGSRVLVKPDKPDERSKSGLIIIPDNAKKPTGTGVVVAMGPGMLKKDGERWPMPDVVPGERVIFDWRSPFPETELNGVKLLVMRDDHLLAVLES
jgi:co-chaperonin GroES (HSP10)